LKKNEPDSEGPKKEFLDAKGVGKIAQGCPGMGPVVGENSIKKSTFTKDTGGRSVRGLGGAFETGREKFVLPGQRSGNTGEVTRKKS